MKITEETVDYVSTLARLRLPPEEKADMAVQLSQIVGYMERLNSLDTEGIPPVSHSGALKNVLRPDEVRPSLDRAALLAGAPVPDEAAFLVPKAVD